MDVTFSRFVAALRNADVRVSPAETLDAFDVLSRVGIESKELVKNSLSLTLAKTREEKGRFDDTFERFFFQLAFQEPAKQSFLRDIDPDEVVGRLRKDLSADLVAAVEAVLNDDRDYLAYRVQRVAEEIDISHISSLREKSVYALQIAKSLSIDELDNYVAAGAGAHDPLIRYLRHYFRTEIRAFVDAQYRLHVDATGRRTILEAALKANLDQLQPEYHAEVRKVVQKLANKLAKEHRRKRKRARRGVLDIKRTLRKNMAYDGAIFDVRWRQTKREKATVYVLCDVSNSVARVARFLLLFLYELTDVLPEIRAFAFSSQLGEVTEVFQRHATEAAIEEVMFVWGKGNTDYSRAFTDFRSLCGTDLNNRSTMIVLGDGRNNYYDPKTQVLKELSRRVKQVFWLNPETKDQWTEGDSEMKRYAPYCFRVQTCNKIRDIEAFADQLLTATR
ncbi:MAG: VWA domain-containing protein [Gammaproteobacteria bacterium]|nr:VWA domain-containing protein [Gammaproteobacteria bacterium]